MSAEERSGDLAPDPPPWEAFEEPERVSRTRRLVILAAIPWVVVAVLAVRTLDRGPGGAPTGVPEAATSPPSSALPTEAGGDRPWRGDGPDPSGQALGTPARGDTPPPTEPTELTALRFGARTAPGPGDAGAVALVVARSWLGTVGPEPAVPVGGADGPPVYVEHVAVEAVDIPTPDAAVVTVVAVVLDHADGGYAGARVVRLGVPVTLDVSGAHPAGAPWWLRPPPLEVRAPRWTPVDDPDALAQSAGALQAAGYRDVDVHELASAGGWPLRASATAVAPGAESPTEHTVWLRDHLGRLVVAGELPDREDQP